MRTDLAFALGSATRDNPLMVFDWDKAAELLRDRNPSYAEAGLKDDWEYTGNYIWENGKPVMNRYTYLASTWAMPLLIMDDGEPIPCYRMEGEVPGWNGNTKWPESALKILNAPKEDAP